MVFFRIGQCKSPFRLGRARVRFLPLHPPFSSKRLAGLGHVGSCKGRDLLPHHTTINVPRNQGVELSQGYAGWSLFAAKCAYRWGIDSATFTPPAYSLKHFEPPISPEVFCTPSNVFANHAHSPQSGDSNLKGKRLTLTTLQQFYPVQPEKKAEKTDCLRKRADRHGCSDKLDSLGRESPRHTETYIR